MIKKNRKLIKEFFKTSKSLSQKIYTLEIFAGFLSIIIFAGYLYHRSSVGFAVISIFLLLIIYYFGIFYIKDYLAGLIIKSSNSFKLNETINTGKYKGKIVNFTKRHLILDNNGNKIVIPYSLILDKTNTIINSQDSIQSFVYKLTINNNIDENIIAEKLKNYIINLPWVNHKLIPDIKTNQNNTKTELQITIYPFDPKYNTKIKQAINEFLEN